VETVIDWDGTLADPPGALNKRPDGATTALKWEPEAPTVMTTVTTRGEFAAGCPLAASIADMRTDP
jgi:hypothetical protein